MLRIFKRIRTILLGILFGAMFLLGTLGILLTVLKYRIFVVYTPSMQDTYPVNSIVLVNHDKAESLQAGDVISFVADEEKHVVTHRIVEKHSEDMEPYFITRGDSNDANDRVPVRYENVLGKVVLGVPYVGRIIAFLNKTAVRYCMMVVLGIIVCVVTIGGVHGAYRNRKGKRDETEHSKNV